jgi:cellulose synthase/poly-beta-1,6-N-acetylglucosamine synthase-like glycosyltransferase
MTYLHAALLLLSAPMLLAAGYLALLTALSARRPAPPRPPPRLRFDVVVPAHDEEGGIERTVASLRALDWPADRFRVLVVADNCSDATARRAEDAGATVLVRQDPEHRGKGFALELAIQRSLADGAADAVVVVDADTLASPGLLAAFAARLEAGAGAIQARYGVLNPRASWRTRLMAIALALFHDLRSLARERLGLSCGLRGNGMCFAVEALRRVPHRAHSVVEDLEYGLRLGEAGLRVHYAHEVDVLGEMVAEEAPSRSQRRRWEAGRLEMVRRHAAGLVRLAWRRRDPVLLDLAIDLLLPPLTWLALACAAGLAGAAALSVAAGRALPALGAWGLAGAMLVAYVARGLALSRMGLRGVAALAWAPAYVLWKVLLAITGSRRDRSEWVRTARPRGTR